MTRLITELQRRGVVKVAAAYALAAWIFIEAGSVLFPTFGASESFFRGYVIFVLIGFVAALILSWFFEFSDGVLQREVSAEEANTSEELKTGSRRVNTAMVVMLAVALCVSLTLNIFGFRNSVVSESVAEDSLSIAVLPFSNISSDPINAVFVDGIHDDLLTKLANVETLRVISRTSVLAYKGTEKNIREIGRELGVHNILEGSVQRVGDRVRINMQLIETATDEHLWAQTYDRELTARNIFDIQSEISTQITSALKTTLSDDEMARVTAVPTENIEAYRLFVSGRQNLHQRLYGTIKNARTQFEQAIELDPNYADAYVGLAEAIMLLNINHNDIPMAKAHIDAQAAIDKALEINPNHADAFATQGLIYMQQIKSDPTARAKAEENYKRALKLNPSNARAWMWYSSLGEGMKDYSKALEYNRKSLNLDPIGRIPHLNIGKLLSALNRNEEATREFAKGVELHPDWPSIYQTMSNHIQRLGRLDEALAWTRAADALDNGPFQNSNIIVNQIELGQTDLALKSIEQIPENNPAKALYEAHVHIASGDTHAALEVARKIHQGSGGKLQSMNWVASNIALMAGDLEFTKELVTKSHPELLERDPTIDRDNASGALKLAYIWLQEDKQKQAEDLLNKVLNVVNQQPRLGIAGHGIRDVQALVLLDRHAEALETFKQAVAEGYISSISFDGIELTGDVYLDSIREDAEFIQQIEIINQRVSTMRARAEAAQTESDWKALREIALSN